LAPAVLVSQGMDAPVSLPDPGTDCRLISADYPVCVETPRLLMTQAQESDVARLTRFMRDNAEHVRDVVPMPTEEFTQELALAELRSLRADWETRTRLRFILTRRDDPGGEVVGMRSFTRIRYGADRSCTMSGMIDHRHVRNGYSTEAARGGIAFCFGVLALHRIDAEHWHGHEVVPAVMAKLGFTRIGIAPAYRWANGAWRDFVLYCRTNPDAPAGDYRSDGPA